MTHRSFLSRFVIVGVAAGLALQVPAVSQAPQASPQEKPAGQQVRIGQSPPTLKTSKTIVGKKPGKDLIGTQETKEPRYFTEDQSDPVEGTVRQILSIAEKHELGAKGLVAIWSRFVSWRITQEKELGGEPSISFGLVADVDDPLFGFDCGPCPQEKDIVLVFRRSDRLEKRACVLARSKTDQRQQTSQRYDFSVSAVDLLDIADAGAARIKWKGLSNTLDLDADDREALRWFVWEKVQGGKDLVRARYGLALSAEPGKGAAEPKKD